MRWLLFLSRIAFICGLFFLISLSLLVKDWLEDKSLVSTIITIGFFMGMIIVPFTLLCYLFTWIAGKKPFAIVPRWLAFSNLLFLFVYASYVYYINFIHPPQW
ncbi:MAG TPA: hypothetical protein PK275_10495 [Chitinophagaceae bacterium]|nr:hypothetical protein [Chitinophagaceae bacterium]